LSLSERPLPPLQKASDGGYAPRQMAGSAGHTGNVGLNLPDGIVSSSLAFGGRRLGLGKLEQNIDFGSIAAQAAATTTTMLKRPFAVNLH
jgi:hypothetical protein